MAKRFFDTKLHKKPWFRKLRWPLREAFRIHCAEADEIGIWEIDMETLNFQINAPEGTDPVTVSEMVEAFGFQVVEDDKLWNPNAVAFQFGDESGEISNKNKLLPKILRMLKARGLPPPSIRDASPIDPPSMGLKNKNKNKEQEKEKEIKGESEGIQAQSPSFDLEALYESYPNKVNKAEGLSRLSDQIQTQADYDDFVTATANYIRYLGLKKNKDWLKPKQWDVFVGAKSKPNKPWREWINPDPSIFEDSGQDSFDPMTAPLRGVS